MDWNNAEEHWKEFKHKLKSRWGKLTDKHLDGIAGKRIELVDKLQETYGITQEEAEKQVQSFESHTKDFRPKVVT